MDSQTVEKGISGFIPGRSGQATTAQGKKKDAIDKDVRRADNIRIAYLCSDIGIPVLGFKGCSVHVREMCHALVSLGGDVSIYALSKGQGNECPHTITEVKRFKRKWIARDIRLILSNMNLYRACKKQFLVEKPNFIYERYGLYSWAGVKLASDFSIPVIVEINTLLAEEEKHRLHSARLARSFESTILNRAGAICCPSDVMKSLLLERGIKPAKIFITPNAVNLKQFDITRDGRDIRRRYGVKGKTIIGYVGLITRLWGMHTILESAGKLLRQRKDFHFMLVGEGRAYSDMKKYIEQNNLSDSFTLTGGIPHEDIPEHIAAMDIAIAPYSYKEPFHGSAMKILEYMAMAKPVIASAQGQIKDIITHGENGLLIEPDDSDGLARTILKLAGNRPMMKTMASKARATAEAYTWEANARKVLNIYKSLLDGDMTRAHEN